MQLLDSVDPNPDNMVCAGIIHTQSQQVGCLLRLEPNRQAQVCYHGGHRQTIQMHLSTEQMNLSTNKLFKYLFIISDVPIDYSIK